jgi:fermentation-respiration switch protein FrsA (DUF1100 family)
MKKISILAIVLVLMFSCNKEQKTDNINTSKTINTMTNFKSGKNKVTFKSQGVMLSGILFTPDNFNTNNTYPTILFSGPVGQIKEQMATNYGEAMSKLGYVYLAFDHIGFGDSEGNLRQDENPFKKMEGIRDGISYLGTLPFVDREKLFTIAGCASASYMPLVVATDKRIKAFATVSGLLDAHARFFGGQSREQITTIIKMSNDARQKLYEEGTLEPIDVLGFEKNNPETLDPNSISGQGYDYYQTERAGKQTFPNYSYKLAPTMFESQPLVSALQWAPYLYTPYLGIYGSEAMDNTAPTTIAFFEKASDPKELFEVKGARHVDLYDYPEFVIQAANKIDAFFKKHSK